MNTLHKLDNELPVMISYRILKIARALEPHAAIVNTLRNKLIEKYGVVEDGIKRVQPNTKEMKEFLKDFNEVLKQEVEVEFEPVKLPNDINISVRDLAAIEKLVII